MTDNEVLEKLKLLIEVGLPAKCEYNSKEVFNNSTSLFVETKDNKKFLVIVLRV